MAAGARPDHPISGHKPVRTVLGGARNGPMRSAFSEVGRKHLLRMLRRGEQVSVHRSAENHLLVILDFCPRKQIELAPLMATRAEVSVVWQIIEGRMLATSPSRFDTPRHPIDAEVVAAAAVLGAGVGLGRCTARDLRVCVRAI